MCSAGLVRCTVLRIHGVWCVQLEFTRAMYQPVRGASIQRCGGV